MTTSKKAILCMSFALLLGNLAFAQAVEKRFSVAYEFSETEDLVLNMLSVLDSIIFTTDPDWALAVPLGLEYRVSQHFSVQTGLKFFFLYDSLSENILFYNIGVLYWFDQEKPDGWHLGTNIVIPVADTFFDTTNFYRGQLIAGYAKESENGFYARISAVCNVVLSAPDAEHLTWFVLPDVKFTFGCRLF